MNKLVLSSIFSKILWCNYSWPHLGLPCWV